MTTSHEIEVYVRFCETDALGHVNNTSFFFYFEEARSKYFENLGIDRERHPSVNLLVASIKCDYISQAFAQQTLKVITDVTHIGTKSFTMGQTLKDSKSGQKIAVASVVNVCFDDVEQKTIPIPKYLREKLEYHQKILI